MSGVQCYASRFLLLSGKSSSRVEIALKLVKMRGPIILESLVYIEIATTN